MQRSGTPETQFAWLRDHWGLDIPAALRLANRAGLTSGTSGSVIPRLPPR
jgi:hypothetical protein